MAFENSGLPFATQAGSYGAEQMRRAIFAAYARTAANNPGIIIGGLISVADLQLSNAVSGLVVNISTGEAIIPGNEGGAQGGYYARNSTTASLTLATANASNPRIDLICVTVDDSGYTPPAGGATGQVSLQAITGTPTSGANVTPGSGGYLSGVGTLPGSSLLLGYVLVPAVATNLISADILNVATPAGVGVGPWAAPASLATHVTAGSAAPQVRTRDSVTSVQGRGLLLFDSTGIALSSTICTLPASVWPSVTRYGLLTLQSGSTPGAAQVSISTGGVVTNALGTTIASAGYSLDSLTYAL